MAFQQSNCQPDSNYFMKKDKKSLDCFKECWENDKKTTNSRPEKPKSKLGNSDTVSSDRSRGRGETNSKSLNRYQTLKKDQHRLYENEIRLTKEIHKKETLLYEKLSEAAERLKKVQLRTVSEDKKKSTEQRNTGISHNRLYYTEKGNWDNAKNRSLGSRKHEEQGEEFNSQVRRKDGIERQENHVKGTNAGHEETAENRGRNTQRNTKTLEKEWSHFEDTWERTETDIRRENVIRQQGNKMREWDQRDWHRKEIGRMNDGERQRLAGAIIKKDLKIDNEAQQWDLSDKCVSSSHFKGKAIAKNDKNLPIEDHSGIQERVQQYRAAEELPLAEAGASSSNHKRLQQVQLSPESCPDTDIQLVPCKLCKRNFTEGRLEKHISICQKTQKPKRQVFDSSKYRAKGTEIEKFLKTNGLNKTPEPKKNNCHQKHKALIQNIQQTQASAPRGFRPGADLHPDYITCPHCSRRFAPGPAERHIPKCQYIKSRAPPPRQRH